ncbi:hypothetical protein E2320_007895 [Naja naja]|nr:hypothetical protein E2320_007895 [Naja naja]
MVLLFCLQGFFQGKERGEDFMLVQRAEKEKTALFSSGKMKRYKEFVALPPPKRKFCQECQQLLLISEWERHSGHLVLSDISAAQLGRPSQLLSALENKKTNAQYLFTDRSCHFLLDLLMAQGFRRVLCVGTPRYSQFYPKEDFCHYNMFNHYFFAGEVRASQVSCTFYQCSPQAGAAGVDLQKSSLLWALLQAASCVCEEFLQEDQGGPAVLVADPPFGGLVEALASSFQKLMAMWSPGGGAGNSF